MLREVLASPGMVTLLIVVVVFQILSIAFLWINLRVFRSHAKKLDKLFEGFESSGSWKKPGGFLVPLYIGVTLLTAVITIAIFIVQPHLL